MDDEIFTGKVRKSGNAHVVTIPKKFRQKHNINKNDRLIVMAAQIPKFASTEKIKERFKLEEMVISYGDSKTKIEDFAAPDALTHVLSKMIKDKEVEE